MLPSLKLLALSATLAISPLLAAQTETLAADWQLNWTRDSPPSGGAVMPNLKLEKTGGKISGFAGCNQFFGSFKATAKTLKFEQVGASKRGCAVGMAQESAFLQALRASSTYTLNANTLTLLDSDSKPLAQFTPRTLASGAAGETIKGTGWSSKTTRYRCDEQKSLEISFLDVEKKRFASLSYKNRLSILEWQVRSAGSAYVALDTRMKLEFDPELGTLSFAPAAAATRAVVLLRDCKPE